MKRGKDRNQPAMDPCAFFWYRHFLQRAAWAKRSGVRNLPHHHVNPVLAACMSALELEVTALLTALLMELSSQLGLRLSSIPW
jgi:hypothetical protein